MPPNDTPAVPIEQRMYPNMPGDAPKAPPAEGQERAPAPAAPTDALAAKPATPPSESGDDTVDDVPETIEERMHPVDGSPPTDGEYAPLVAGVFERLGLIEREAGQTDNLQAIADGKRLVAETMAEFGVGAPGAREIAHVFGRYRESPVDDMEGAAARSTQQLRELWGNRYDVNVRHAQRAFRAACQRIPWLADEVNLGAGNDATVIKHFAAIGRRMSRKKG